MIDTKINNFEKKIGIVFENKELIKQVFVHRSYLNEHKHFNLAHNERLEFLGDAVLELVVTEFLYRNYEEPEGVLTNWRSALVKGESLSKISDKLGLDDLLLLSKGEKNSSGKGRKLILANAFEALLGAIYLEKGYKTVEDFIKKYLIVNLNEIIKNELYIDAKSKLQEFVQEKYSITPHYVLISETGPDHAKKFIMSANIDQEQIALGEGRSKQDAEQSAARNALDKLSK